ncbi:MAG TPA: acyl-CoA dehydrogenase family protein, partial [Lacipirellulaceae bacterium]|nr:acyl-CoA dehydrogenase family protein [Lacipirellulaceae bacterium]
MAARRITSPDDPALAELCALLADRAVEMDRTGQWPAEQLRLCGECGVYEWFIDPMWGGQGWSEEKLVRGYLALSAACLTTTFVLTQRTGACRRVAGSGNQALRERLLPGLASGELFATVGISHLTTSRRHLAKPVLTAEAIPAGFRLNGMSPWVTGGAAADVIVLAATLVEQGEATDRQLLIAAPADTAGLSAPDPLPLIGVSASSTGPVLLDGAEVSEDWLIAGPVPNVMSSGAGGNTGSYETSTLAVGLAQAAVEYLATEAAKRPDLAEPMWALRAEHKGLLHDLLGVARGDAGCTKESVRQRANSLVLRATQAALSAAKGTGYVVGHPA